MGNRRKFTLKQRLVRYLLKDVSLDELHIGAHSIVITGDVIKLNPLPSDPSGPAEGWIWHLAGTTHKPRYHDGTSARDIGEGATPGAHASTHQSGGADEINVAGLSGELADPQPPKAHAASHKSGGSDVIALDELGAPAGPVDMNSQRLANVGAPTAAGDTIPADANLRAPDSSALEGNDLAAVRDHDPKAHASSHLPGGSDQLFDQSLNTTDSPSFAQVTIGDLVMKNGWRLTEHKKYGVVFQSPEGKLYRMELMEC